MFATARVGAVVTQSDWNLTPINDKYTALEEPLKLLEMYLTYYYGHVDVNQTKQPPVLMQRSVSGE